MPEKDDIVIDVCERSVVSGIGVFKRDERGLKVCGAEAEVVVTGRVRSESSRFGQALCWPTVAEVP